MPGSTPRRKARKVSPSGRKSRARSSELALRRRRVGKLRFVQCWTIADIAQQLGVSEETIKRDVIHLRKISRRFFKANRGDIAADLFDELQASYEERKKILWNEYLEVVESGEQEEQSKAGGEFPVARTKLKLAILDRIQDMESQHVEVLRKLGVLVGEESEGEGSFLVELRGRFTGIKKASAGEVSDSKAASSGGGDGDGST